MKYKKQTIDTKDLKHIAFIIDGNGRWAKKRGLPRTVGHKHGYEKVKMALRHCSNLGIPVTSIWAFSTENWNRPKSEIDEIFRLIRENMDVDTPMFNELGIRVTTMGDLSRFPKDLQDSLARVKSETKNNTGMVFNLCINYGGRADILHAIHNISRTTPDILHNISESDFSKHLYGADLPNPDFIIRTSGEQRLSGFMSWQMAYSELMFIKPHWPAITPKIIDDCIINYSKRERRFGKVKA